MMNLISKIKQTFHRQKLIELQSKVRNWQHEKEIVASYEQMLKEQRELIGTTRKISTTKRLVNFLFLNCTIVEIYALWAMTKMQDLSALSVLISAIIGEVIAFAIYSIKSMRENMKNGIVYDMAMKDKENTPGG